MNAYLQSDLFLFIDLTVVFIDGPKTDLSVARCLKIQLGKKCKDESS